MVTKKEPKNHDRDVVQALNVLLKNKQFTYGIEGVGLPYSPYMSYQLKELDSYNLHLRIYPTEKSFLERGPFSRGKLLQSHRDLLEHYDKSLYYYAGEKTISGEEKLFNNIYNLAIERPELTIYSSNIDSVEINFNSNTTDCTIYEIKLSLRGGGAVTIGSIQDLEYSDYFLREKEKAKQKEEDEDDLPF